MANILAIETTGSACSVAWCDTQQGVVHALARQAPREMSRHLLPLMRECLAHGGWTLSRLDAVAVNQGPGNYTGLRLAAAVAQGLAVSLDLPMVPVPVLPAMVFSAAVSDRPMLAALDVRMQMCVYGLYWHRSAAELIELAPMQRCHHQQLAKQITSPTERVGCLWGMLDKASFIPMPVSATVIGRYAIKKWQGNECCAPEACDLIYAREGVE